VSILAVFHPRHNSNQRNDALDAYNTYPLHSRPDNGPKDAFADGVRHTQCDNLFYTAFSLTYADVDSQS